MMRVYVPGYTIRCAGYDDEGRLFIEVTPIIGPDAPAANRYPSRTRPDDHAGGVVLTVRG